MAADITRGGVHFPVLTKVCFEAISSGGTLGGISRAVWPQCVEPDLCHSRHWGRGGGRVDSLEADRWNHITLGEHNSALLLVLNGSNRGLTQMQTWFVQ